MTAKTAKPSVQSAAEAAMRADKAVVIGLNAAIVTVSENEPKILIVPHDEADGAGGWDALPFGPFNPMQHRTLEI
ncbi:MAG: NAD regulator, partial [Parvibaculum sp.]|nr:NAD regulator [Parvibaculum sp.]